MSNSQVQQTTRQALFEKVWAEPMRLLAPKFGLSDVGLAKLCRRVGVPLPPMGYWARSAKKRRRPHLPPAADGQNETITITSNHVRRVDVTADLPKDIAELRSALNQETEIGVPATCPRNYPMFDRWDTADRRAGFSLSDRRPALSDIEKRRRKILYAIIRQIEKWEGRITAVDQHKFKIEIGSNELAFTLREPSNRVQRPLTQQEMRWYSDRDSMPDLKPSGKLRLLIEEYFDRPIQKSWGDLPGKQLETRAREVLDGLLIALSESRRRRLHWEDYHRQRALEEQQRLATEERRREEEAKLQKLKGEAAAWFEANRIRQYVAAALRGARRCRAPMSKIKAWAASARTMANSLDPLSLSSGGSEVLG